MEGKPRLSHFVLCLLTLTILYGIGGFVFSRLEREAELASYEKNRFFYEQMKELYSFDHCKDPWFKDMDFCKNQGEFHGMLQDFFERNGNEMKDHEKWTFFGSMFFVSTLVTTLGYGSLHPLTPGGQLFTIVFGLIGIPLMGYALSFIAHLVLEVWMPLYRGLDMKTRRILVLSALVPFFILMGGIMFMLLEPWTYLEACYFSACTLFTVGFGDYLPSHVGSKLATMIFIFFGLGVAASLIAVLVLQVEERGERFASTMGDWYDTLSAGECCGGGDRSRA